MAKKYFENNWRAIKNTPPQDFQRVTFEDVMNYHAGWSLPSSTCCVIRSKEINTQRVTEYTYRRRHAADKRLHNLLKQDGLEIVTLTEESMHIIRPRLSEDEAERLLEEDPDYGDIDLTAPLEAIYDHLEQLNTELEEEEEE